MENMYNECNDFSRNNYDYWLENRNLQNLDDWKLDLYRLRIVFLPNSSGGHLGSPFCGGAVKIVMENNYLSAMKGLYFSFLQ